MALEVVGRMRVLFLGRVDRYDGRSSLGNVARQLLTEIVNRHDDVHVQWATMDSVSEDEFRWYVDSYLRTGNDRRIAQVPIQASVEGRELGYFATDEVWRTLRQVRADIPYDVVLCNQPAMIPVYAFLLHNRYRASQFNVRVPIVGWQVWTATESMLENVPEYYAGENDVLAESMSSIAADANVWESTPLWEDHLRTIRKWLAPSAVRNIVGKSQVVNSGIPMDQLDLIHRRRIQRMRAQDGPNLFWGSRLAGQKQPKRTFPLMEKLALAIQLGGKPLVTTQTDVGAKAEAYQHQYPLIEFRFGANRSAFHDAMAVGDVFLCHSICEGYGSAWLEMLGAGMLGVFKDEWWVRPLLPYWYPFIAKNDDEMIEMAHLLLGEWPYGLWNEYGDRIRQWVRDMHDVPHCAESLWSVMNDQHERVLKEDQQIAGRSIGVLVLDACMRLGNEFTEDELHDKMRELSDADREWGKRGDIVSRMYIRRMAECHGWRDTCEDDAVRFRHV